jgi:hypothetical protein
VVLQRTPEIENNLASNWKIEGNHTTGRLSWREKKARGKNYTNSEMNVGDERSRIMELK